MIFGLVKKVPLFDTFLCGARKGVDTLMAVAPTLVGLIVAVNMLKSSGVMDWLTKLISPVANYVGFPTEIVPLVLLRPISGGGSTALLSGILKEVGPDSFPGRVASVLAGSTETTFYAITVYFGSVKVKKIRHTLIAALGADFTAVIMALLSVRLFI